MRIQLMKFFLILLLNPIFSYSSVALDQIPLDKIVGSPLEPQSTTTHPYVRTLQTISQDEHLAICRQDLQDFIANPKDPVFAELNEQKKRFNGPKLAAMLKEKFKDKKKYPKISKPKVDDFGKVVSILIHHGKTRCVISIHPDLEVDQLKSSVSLPDQTELVLRDGSKRRVETNLVGVSSSIEELGVHLDGSKAMTILKQLHQLEMREQIKQLEIFQKIESTPTSDPATARNKKTAT